VALIIVFSLSCEKDDISEGPVYKLPVLPDSVFKRAYYFAIHKWGDSVGVSHLSDTGILFELLLDRRATDRQRFKITEADRNALQVDSAMYYDTPDRIKFIGRVSLQFVYMLNDSAARQDSTFNYLYHLTDPLFNR
jgi:hypothetical protein